MMAGQAGKPGLVKPGDTYFTEVSNKLADKGFITADVAVTRLTDTTYRVSNFNWVVGQEGLYVLSVAGAGVQDPAGNAGTGSAFPLSSMGPTCSAVTAACTSR